ncbi:MAG: hypothetical protein ACAI25_13435, partial [Planctomycetota bacterium]
VSGLAGPGVEVRAPATAVVDGDATRLRQVLANLVANGLRHGTRVAIEVGVRSWLVREVVRLRGGLVAAPFARHAGALFALSAAMWFAVLGVLVFAGLVAHELGVVAVLVWGGFVGWLSARAAPVLAVLAKDPALGARAIGPGRELYQRAPWPWRWTVLVELVVLGAVTYVHYSGDEALAFNGAVVTELTTSNGWPKAVAAATRSSVPIAVFYGARLFTAFASTLFVAAYVILGEESKDAG